jgi:hypothetical protein
VLSELRLKKGLADLPPDGCGTAGSISHAGSITRRSRITYRIFRTFRTGGFVTASSIDLKIEI